LLLAGLGAGLGAGLSGGAAQGQAIPPTQAAALDGHKVSLPADLPGRANVLIVGFGRNSADATTPWEKAVRTQLAKPGAIGFYDMAMLAEVPGFVRPMVVRAIRHKVAGYAADQPEAAYVLLVDRSGHVVWSTHAAFTPVGFAELSKRAQDLASSVPKDR
jgi:hypothetical protein